ncbi:thiamine pyrophosphate-binding protein [Thermomonas sp.]|uniref:thiamine pyrophosphate-binding protein n=1 Tax=Thermomonas sp. TaxID=1971895 RepID=UPI0035B1EA97
MNCSDTIFKMLAELGITHCYAVPGGGIMYLVDAAGRQSGFQTRFFHHEQAAGFAAEAHGRVENRPAVCLATIGPGAANAISAAFSCFINSVPCLFISGAKRSTFQTDYPRQRFNFPQDGDTEGMATPVVKHYHCLSANDDISQVVTQLVDLACSGRPGPVWLDVALDIQASQVAGEPQAPSRILPAAPTNDVTNALLTFLAQVERPVFLMGRGCESVFRCDDYRRFLRDARLPFITTVGSNHLLKAAGQMNLGCFGPTGRRAANRILTEADALVAIGSGLDIDTTGFDRSSFFRNKRILTINADACLDIQEAADWTQLTTSVRNIDFSNLACRLAKQDRYAGWATFCRSIEALLSTQFEIDLNLTNTAVDPYLFCQRLGLLAPDDTGFVGGISLDIVAFSHVTQLRGAQEFYLSPHAGQLGWDIPATVGIADSGRFGTIVCLTGDGSLMFNLQELATLRRIDRNIVVIIFDNGGYNSIRTSQDAHLGGRHFGSDPEWLGFPDWAALSQAFGYRYMSIEENDGIDAIRQSMTGGHWFVRIKIDPERGRTPRLVSKIRDGKFVSPTIFDQFPELPPHIEAAYAALKANL